MGELPRLRRSGAAAAPPPYPLPSGRPVCNRRRNVGSPLAGRACLSDGATRAHHRRDGAVMDYDAEMKLPEGKICSDCRHFEQTCVTLIDVVFMIAMTGIFASVFIAHTVGRQLDKIRERLDKLESVEDQKR